MMRAITGCVLILALCAAHSATAANDCKDIGIDGVRRESVPGRLIVQPKDVEKFQDLLKGDLGRLQGERLQVRPVGKTGFFAIDSASQDTDAVFDHFSKQRGQFYSMQEDRAVYGMEVPLEETFRMGQMWGLNAIHAPEAWNFGTGSSDVVVAVLDSGIDREHDDLARNTWKIKNPFVLQGNRFRVDCHENEFGFDAMAGNCRPAERNRHGTRISGIIGADGRNDGVFVVGVNWSVTLLPVAILDRTNTGCASRAAAALEFVRLMKTQRNVPVRVVNLSWGMFEPSDMVRQELETLANEDVVIVAAAGNSGNHPAAKVLYPAAYKTIPSLISVGATNERGDVAGISTRDKDVIDIGAPGERILTTEPTQRTVFATGGTSLSTAFVSGAVALIASQCPALNAAGLKKLILDNADKKSALADDFIEGRFLNLHAAAKACAALTP
jgi:subtilisin family serine protease